MPVLERDRVVPPPLFHPYIEVGRDYFGGSLTGLREFKAFEAAVPRVHSRFSDDTPLGERDFASAYIFSFLEACVGRCCRRDEPLSPTAISVEESLSDLARTLASDSWEVACCREVSHLATSDGEPIDLSGVTVVPLSHAAGDHSREANAVIESIIPGAQSAHRREAPGGFDPPQSIVTARGFDAKPFDLADVLSARIDRFLLFSRLLHAGTCHSMYEVRGETSFVRRFRPTLVQFRGDGGLVSSTRMVRRTTRLDAEDRARIAGLTSVFDQVVRPQPGVVVTSFEMALHKFELSYHSYAWYEQVVDLATAFEAVLSGKDKTDILLRLKTRAAALLATEKDPAVDIFKDVGLLYDVRSSYVPPSSLRPPSSLCVGVGVPPENPVRG